MARTPAAAVTTNTTIPAEETYLANATPDIPTRESAVSGVCWASILGGAAVAAAVSLILLMLGSAVGLSTTSPWSSAASIATAITANALIWLIVMQWAASGLGGYVAGRLRTKWVGVHTDEVFFRDTAHGFLSWAVATLLTAAFLASAGSAVIGGGVSAAAAVAASDTKSGSDPMAYYVDELYRGTTNPAAVTSDASGEASRILTAGLSNGDLSPNDRAYLTQQVSARTGLAEPEAQARVDTTVAQVKDQAQKARQAADTARKTGATLSLYMFLSLLVGAFVASVAAAVGGKQRDTYAFTIPS